MAQPPSSQIGELVLLIEPDAVIRRSLLNWLRSAMPECTAAGGASMQEALTLAQCKWPSVVVLDLADPEMDGAATVTNIKSAVPCAHVVALTMDEGAEYLEELACAGASAHILIWRTHAELVPVIKALLAVNRKSRSTELGRSWSSGGPTANSR